MFFQDILKTNGVHKINKYNKYFEQKNVFKKF